MQVCSTGARLEVTRAVPYLLNAALQVWHRRSEVGVLGASGDDSRR